MDHRWISPDHRRISPESLPDLYGRSPDHRLLRRKVAGTRRKLSDHRWLRRQVAEPPPDLTGKSPKSCRTTVDYAGKCRILPDFAGKLPDHHH
ncbi:hypothetical protein WN944_017041 [Citrus x changshan-huyou]|uniref:Uncharacterized protein n=1 Tax=Citrus x changshan-huyou TaxID=2935761 RepID=A0AAP0MAI1_9ROSI